MPPPSPPNLPGPAVSSSCSSSSFHLLKSVLILLKFLEGSLVNRSHHLDSFFIKRNWISRPLLFHLLPSAVRASNNSTSRAYSPAEKLILPASKSMSTNSSLQSTCCTVKYTRSSLCAHTQLGALLMVLDWCPM